MWPVLSPGGGTRLGHRSLPAQEVPGGREGGPAPLCQEGNCPKELVSGQLRTLQARLPCSCSSERGGEGRAEAHSQAGGSQRLAPSEVLGSGAHSTSGWTRGGGVRAHSPDVALEGPEGSGSSQGSPRVPTRGPTQPALEPRWPSPREARGAQGRGAQGEREGRAAPGAQRDSAPFKGTRADPAGAAPLPTPCPSPPRPAHPRPPRVLRLRRPEWRPRGPDRIRPRPPAPRPCARPAPRPWLCGGSGAGAQPGAGRPHPRRPPPVLEPHGPSRRPAHLTSRPRSPSGPRTAAAAPPRCPAGPACPARGGGEVGAPPPAGRGASLNPYAAGLVSAAGEAASARRWRPPAPPPPQTSTLPSRPPSSRPPSLCARKARAAPPTAPRSRVRSQRGWWWQRGRTAAARRGGRTHARIVTSSLVAVATPSHRSGSTTS